ISGEIHFPVDVVGARVTILRAKDLRTPAPPTHFFLKQGKAMVGGLGSSMSDPRLNSVHLDAPRRQLFRQAREALLNARGWQTLAAEQSPAGEQPPGEDAAPDSPNTMVLDADNPPPPEVKYWLVDQESLYPLKVGLNTIGRAPENDVVVPDAYVSR